MSKNHTNIVKSLLLLSGLIYLSAPIAQAQCPLHFTDISTDSPDLAAFQHSGKFSSPGVAFADYDNDGYPDIYVANGKGSPNKLFRNNRDGTFTDVTNAAGVSGLVPGVDAPNAIGRSPLALMFADLNNDRFPDLYVVNDSKLPDNFFLNNGDGTFAEIAFCAGVSEPMDSRGLAFADIDSDILRGNRRYDHPTLFRNDLANNNNWLHIKQIS